MDQTQFDSPIKFKIMVNKPAAVVFDLLSQAEGWDAWFTTCTILNLRPDGDILFQWKDWGPDKISVSAKGKVISFKRPNQLSFYWNYGLAGGPTRVDFSITETADGTLVQLYETGYPNTKAGHEMLLECATGWGEALTLMKIYLEHGISYK